MNRISKDRPSQNQLGLQPPEHSIYERITALASLYALLAGLLTYPSSRQQIQEMLTMKFVEECMQLLACSAINDRSLNAAFADLLDMVQDSNIEEPRLFRIEYTRLFITPPIIISLEGCRWIKNRTPTSKRCGEGFAVEQIYRQLGLKMRAHAKDRPDHLISELDYMSYVTNAEALAWDAGDITNANEWRKLSRSFIKAHLHDLALGTSSAIQSLSSNKLLLFSAALLKAMVSGTA